MRRVLIAILGFLVLLCLAGFLWTFLPVERQIQKVEFPPDMQEKFGGLVLQVDKPQEIRLGENENLVVKILPSDPASETIPHAILFQSKIEIPGITIVPSATMQDRYDDGRGVSFSWRMIPRETGDFPGTIWIYVQPGAGSTSSGITGEPIFALPVTLIVGRVLGLPLNVLRGLAFTITLLIGMLIAVILLVWKPDQHIISPNNNLSSRF